MVAAPSSHSVIWQTCFDCQAFEECLESGASQKARQCLAVVEAPEWGYGWTVALTEVKARHLCLKWIEAEDRTLGQETEARVDSPDLQAVCSRADYFVGQLRSAVQCLQEVEIVSVLLYDFLWLWTVVSISVDFGPAE